MWAKSFLLTSVLVIGIGYSSNAEARFLSQDPVQYDPNIHDPAMFGRYVYSFNNPINMIDPDGRAPDRVMDVRAQALHNTAKVDPSGGVRVAAGAMAISAGVAGAVVAAPSAAAACTGVCVGMSIGATAGSGVETKNQIDAGQGLNPIKIGLAAGIGAAAGAGAVAGGPTIGGQMLGAGTAGGLAGGGAEVVNQTISGEHSGVGVAAAVMKTGLGSALGAGAGGSITNKLTQGSLLGAAGVPTSSGAAAGAIIGEGTSIGANTAAEKIIEDR